MTVVGPVKKTKMGTYPRSESQTEEAADETISAEPVLLYISCVVTPPRLYGFTYPHAHKHLLMLVQLTHGYVIIVHIVDIAIAAITADAATASLNPSDGSSNVL